MAAFSAEIAPSHSLGRWDLASMVETGGSCERTVKNVREVPDSDRDGRHLFHDTPRANRSIW